jgi:hypothetical protein
MRDTVLDGGRGELDICLHIRLSRLGPR